MGTSKQDQLDLFEGRAPSDEDCSDTDQDQEGSGQQQRTITAGEPFAPQQETLGSSPQPSRSFTTWQNAKSEDTSSMQGFSQCSCQSDEAAMTHPSHKQANGDDNTNPLEPVQDSPSSDDTSSSDSGSSSNSDDDAEGVPPIQIRTL